MCRNIRTLYNYDPPVSEAEIREAEIAKAQARTIWPAINRGGCLQRPCLDLD